MTTPHGPYRTREQACADSGRPTEANRANRLEHLTAALTATGVRLGDFDRAIAAWLSGWEPDTVQVVIGWVERAHAAATQPGRLVSAVEADFDAIRGRLNGGAR